MSEAPKRIWIDGTDDRDWAWGQIKEFDDDIEYIRADLVEAAIKRALDDSQNLRVIVYREGDTFIARCVQYDILTQGPDAEEVQQRMDRLMDAELASGTCPVYTRADMEAAVKRALEAAAQACEDLWIRAENDRDEGYDEGLGAAMESIRALDPAQFIEEEKG